MNLPFSPSPVLLPDTGLLSPRSTAPLAEAAQQPPWPDLTALADAVERLASLPPLTTPAETGLLRAELAAVCRGEGLVLHGGDCAEPFADSAPPTVLRKVSHLRALTDLLRDGAGAARGIAIGRIAGQYAKPRSEAYETTPDRCRMHSYRGDAVNAFEPDPTARVPDPARLLAAHTHATRVLETIRSRWRGSAPGERVYVSHELLLLPFERALLVAGERPGEPAHAGSTHFGWIGERSRALHGAHVSLAASVTNPVGVKLGPGTAPQDAVNLALRLNPERVAGRLTFIVRMGAEQVAAQLPAVVRAVTASGVPVVWLCDPMHGNTVRLADGTKTRRVSVLCQEVTGFAHAVRAHGGHPGGLSLELTPDPVTECLDGPPPGAADLPAPAEATGRDLLPDYRSLCDPRLNPAQAEAVVQSFLAAL
ncbi:3-deoxy-7-phosphoheptulonate synthase [Streptomyces sp. MA15]|uniref:3-deoxy-7-phosphoheptulonate synthase n=1 Tax=Streptomyces sp. MA15 TaxID=3055061 RepID=UPI0025B0851B|nr:3-deoxy-7-phosphoheptulonate synthase [Streptomyces sp. MA15]MDN3267113.1 3-deoxy-7-phosphoheptulonate synthase [Streptomyces sp. MA15]